MFAQVIRRGDTMFKPGVQLSVLLAAVLATACGSARDENTARVMIDMRCGSNADCPSGFQCEAETEHGPPTTMCQSDDATTSCPRGYETHVGYGQVFCVPQLGVRAQGEGASITADGRAGGVEGGARRGNRL